MNFHYEGIDKEKGKTQRPAVLMYRIERPRESFAAEQIVQYIKEDFPGYMLERPENGIIYIHVNNREEFEVLKEYYHEAKTRVKREMWRYSKDC